MIDQNIFFVYCFINSRGENFFFRSLPKAKEIWTCISVLKSDKMSWFIRIFLVNHFCQNITFSKWYVQTVALLNSFWSHCQMNSCLQCHFFPSLKRLPFENSYWTKILPSGKCPSILAAACLLTLNSQVSSPQFSQPVLNKMYEECWENW